MSAELAAVVEGGAGEDGDPVLIPPGVNVVGAVDETYAESRKNGRLNTKVQTADEVARRRNLPESSLQPADEL
eukprot:2675924-Rhodomonas_salina.1